MPTAKQTAAALARVLPVPEGRMIFAADQLRRAGLLPAAQGLPTEIGARQTALLLLSALLGTPAGTQPHRVTQYGAADDEHGALVDALASMLAEPAGFVRLQLDLQHPAALLTTTSGARHFGDGTFERSATFSADALHRLLLQLRAAPVLRAGRPTNEATHARNHR